MAEAAGLPERRRAAALAMVAMAGLIAVKLVLSAVTGSVAILAEAAHSASILVGVDRRGARGTRRVRDGRGPGGRARGRGVRRDRVRGGARASASPVDALGAGIAGMAACSLVAGLVARLRRAPGARGVVAGAAGRRGAACAATSITSGLVAGALGLVALTGLDALDALAALGIALVVARGGRRPDPLRAARVRGPRRRGDRRRRPRARRPARRTVIGYRRLRARTAGGVRRIDVDVTVRRDATAAQVDTVRRTIGDALEERLPDARIVVHVVRPTRRERAVPDASRTMSHVRSLRSRRALLLACIVAALLGRARGAPRRRTSPSTTTTPLEVSAGGWLERIGWSWDAIQRAHYDDVAYPTIAVVDSGIDDEHPEFADDGVIDPGQRGLPQRPRRVVIERRPRSA